MTTTRLFLAQLLLWLCTLTSPAAVASNLTMADLQDGVGGLELGEGRFEHAALHGLVGCAAGEALGGSCGSGAASAIAQSVFSGLQDGAPERQPGQTDTDYAAVHAAWEKDIGAQAQLLGTGVGYLTSGGQAANVSNGAGIAQSGALNNYLNHMEESERITARRALEQCGASAQCSAAEIAAFEDTIAYWTALDKGRDAELRQTCEADPNGILCHSLVLQAAQSIGLAPGHPMEDLARADFSGSYSKALARYREYGEELTGDPFWDALAETERWKLEEFASTVTLLNEHRDVYLTAGRGVAALNILEGALTVAGGFAVTRPSGGVPNRTIDTDLVSFGRNDNQVYHAWRHIDEIGMDRTVVRNAILDDIPVDLPSGATRRTLNVNGTDLEYRIFKLPDGTYNIGTVFEVGG